MLLNITIIELACLILFEFLNLYEYKYTNLEQLILL